MHAVCDLKGAHRRWRPVAGFAYGKIGARPQHLIETQAE